MSLVRFIVATMTADNAGRGSTGASGSTRSEDATDTGESQYDRRVDNLVEDARETHQQEMRENSPEDPRARGQIQPYVSPGFRLAAAWSWRGIVIVAALGLAFYLLGQFKTVLLSALIALLLAGLLSPLCQLLIRHRWPRALAALVTVIGFLVVVLGLLGLVGQQLYSGFNNLWTEVRDGFIAISTWLQSNPLGIDSTQISKYIDQGVAKATQFAEQRSGQLASGALGAASTVTDFFAGLLLTLFSTFFFVYDGHKISRWFIGLLPAPAREKAAGAALRGWQSLVQYVRVQIIVAAVDAFGIGLGAVLLGLPLAVPLTLLVFLGSFIPVIGAVVTGVVAVVIALVAKGFVPAVIMLLVVLAVQQIESHVLQPFIMGKAVSVHPLAVVLGVTAGGFMFGIPGALFAVPLMAVLNTSVLYLRGRDIMAEAHAETAEKKRARREARERRKAARSS